MIEFKSFNYAIIKVRNVYRIFYVGHAEEFLQEWALKSLMILQVLQVNFENKI